MADSKLSDMETDALKEIGNIGSGNASKTLSDLVKEKINIELTEISVLPVKELVNVYGDEKHDEIVAIFLRVSGSIFGSVVTLFQSESAKMILELIDKQKIEALNINPELEKKFGAVGGGVAKSYVTALKDFLGITINESDPLVQINKKDIIINLMIRNILQTSVDDVLLMRTKFSVENHELAGEFMSLFGLRSMEEFRRAIKDKLFI